MAMAITFNTSALPGGLSATGLYCRIQNPYLKKVDQIGDVAAHWQLSYEMIIQKDANARANNGERVHIPSIDRGSVTLANLDSVTAANANPFTLAYADLKSWLASRSLATNIEDEI
jgi:hypothetical protein